MCAFHENLTILPAKSDSDVMFCLQGYRGLVIACVLHVTLSTG